MGMTKECQIGDSCISSLQVHAKRLGTQAVIFVWWVQKVVPVVVAIQLMIHLPNFL